VNIHQLTELEHALELPSFKNLIALQIHSAVQNLKQNWFPALETIFLQVFKMKTTFLSIKGYKVPIIKILTSLEPKPYWLLHIGIGLIYTYIYDLKIKC
jgi:hypothetical protein